MDTAAPGQPRHVSKALILVVVVIGFATTFASGYFLSQLLAGEQAAKGNAPPATTQPDATAPQNPTDQSSKTQPQNPDHSKGKVFISDEAFLVTKDKPTIAIQAYVARLESAPNKFVQAPRMIYFDGKSWVFKTASTFFSDSNVHKDTMINSWDITIDPTRLLKQSAKGELTIDGKHLAFSTGDLFNEIGVRSLPGFSRWISSNASASLTVDGVRHDAYVWYTRNYTPDFSEIQTLSAPIGVTTDLLGFWDEQGNFYHLDASQVTTPTPIYASHLLGVLDMPNGIVEKTFQVGITRDSISTPKTWTIQMNSPINSTLSFAFMPGGTLNKVPPKPDHTWILGLVEGTITKPDGSSVKGIGTMEYVHMEPK